MDGLGKGLETQIWFGVPLLTCNLAEIIHPLFVSISSPLPWDDQGSLTGILWGLSNTTHVETLWKPFVNCKTCSRTKHENIPGQQSHMKNFNTMLLGSEAYPSGGLWSTCLPMGLQRDSTAVSETVLYPHFPLMHGWLTCITHFV